MPVADLISPIKTPKKRFHVSWGFYFTGFSPYSGMEKEQKYLSDLRHITVWLMFHNNNNSVIVPQWTGTVLITQLGAFQYKQGTNIFLYLWVVLDSLTVSVMWRNACSYNGSSTLGPPQQSLIGHDSFVLEVHLGCRSETFEMYWSRRKLRTEVNTFPAATKTEDSRVFNYIGKLAVEPIINPVGETCFWNVCDSAAVFAAEQ